MHMHHHRTDLLACIATLELRHLQIGWEPGHAIDYYFLRRALRRLERMGVGS